MLRHRADTAGNANERFFDVANQRSTEQLTLVPLDHRGGWSDVGGRGRWIEARSARLMPISVA